MAYNDKDADHYEAYKSVGLSTVDADVAVRTRKARKLGGSIGLWCGAFLVGLALSFPLGNVGMVLGMIVGGFIGRLIGAFIGFLISHPGS